MDGIIKIQTKNCDIHHSLFHVRSWSETVFAKSKAVRISSRVYADTYEECIDLFNFLKNEKVKWFLERAEETKKGLIEK